MSGQEIAVRETTLEESAKSTRTTEPSAQIKGNVALCESPEDLDAEDMLWKYRKKLSSIECDNGKVARAPKFLGNRVADNS